MWHDFAAAAAPTEERKTYWLGLAWLGLAWLGLAWLGLAWLGLAWLGNTVLDSLERGVVYFVPNSNRR